MKKAISDISGIFSKLGKQTQLSNQQRDDLGNSQQSSLLDGLSKASGLFQMDQSALKEHEILNQFDFSQMVDSFSGLDASVINVDEMLGDKRPSVSPQTESLRQDNQTVYPAVIRNNLDLLTSESNQDFQVLVNNLKTNALDEEQRRVDVSHLRQWVRSHLIEKTLTEYIASSNAVDHHQKDRFIGELLVVLTRLEMVMGWIHLGGVNQSPLPTWERSAPDNLDEYYTADMSHSSQHAYADWGSAFMGSNFKQAGINESILSSGLFQSAKAFHDGTLTLSHCTTIPTDKWVALSQAFNADQKSMLLSQFFQQNFTLSAGDIIVLGRKSHRWKSQNDGELAMVEKYDPTSEKLHLIRGDFDRNRVGGEVRTLSNLEDWEDVIAAVRFHHSAFKPSLKVDSQISNTLVESCLLSLKRYTHEILRIGLLRGWFHNSDISASVAELYQDPNP